FNPEQVSDFYPTPSTVSTCIYYTGLDPRTMEHVYCATSPHEKALQRALIQYRNPKNHALVREALVKAGREDLIGFDAKCLVRPAGAKGPRGGKGVGAQHGGKPGQAGRSHGKGKGTQAKRGGSRHANGSRGEQRSGNTHTDKRTSRNTNTKPGGKPQGNRRNGGANGAGRKPAGAEARRGAGHPKKR
nr:DUF3362 domain-containing protein [Eggerthellaceae bacterium]